MVFKAQFRQKPPPPSSAQRFLFAALVVSILAFPWVAWGADNAGIVEECLGRISLSEDEKADVLRAVRTTPSRMEWLLSGEGQVYSLALRPVRKDNRPGVQVKLEEMARHQANLRAHYLLYLRAAPEKRRSRYADADSLAEALARWDEGAGKEKRLKPNLSAAVALGDWAFALARARGEVLEELGARVESLGELDQAYCSALYPKARALFERKEYQRALPIYRELHALRWARPGAYLDAAECFLRVGDRRGAAYLVEETAAELGETMNSELLERAGDLLAESGEEEKAARLYRLASERLRQER
ncbi:MAG: hypothetical protein LBD04_03215 [Synergistaceae bacterium]|jgi:hypothetical protein|nr:hypothetical protein [Synergistaceae bacterium]